MSLSQPLSSSTSSQKTPNLTNDYSDTSTEELSDSSPSSPAMRPRRHVLDGMPEDIKRYWLYNFILDWNASRPADIAKTLHHLATISKEHQQEVIHVVQNEPSIAMDYTAHAMRGLAEMAIALPSKNKSCARRQLMAKPEGVVSDNDVDVYNFGKKVEIFAELYPTFSINLSTDERKEFNHSEWLRAALQELFNPALATKRVRFDFSVRHIVLAPLKNRNTVFGKKLQTETLYLGRKLDDVRGSPIRIIAELVTKLKKITSRFTQGPSLN